MSTQQTKFKEIADAIRDKTGSTELIKPSAFKDEIPKVYEAGEDNAITAFWETLFENGEVSNARARFAYTKIRPNIFRPPFTIKPTGSVCKELFYYCSSTEPIDCIALEEELGYPIFDFSECTNMEYQFSVCKAFSRLGIIDMSKSIISNRTFYSCEARYIKKIIVSEDTAYESTFRAFSLIEHCLFEGTIGKNGLDLTQSTKLDKESLSSVITCLSSTTTGLKATLSKIAVNKAFETSEGANDGSTSAEWLALVNTKTNWTISLA